MDFFGWYSALPDKGLHLGLAVRDQSSHSLMSENPEPKPLIRANAVHHGY
jgi:hypothetical protein